MRVSAVILAAGRGERFGGDKTTALLGGKPVWQWSFERYLSHPLVHSVGLVGNKENLPQLRDPRAAFVIGGGENRQESSRLGTEAADGEIVIIHDAARPFVSEVVIARVIGTVKEVGAAAPGVTSADTLRSFAEGSWRLLDRERTARMQTPQGAKRELLLKAHAQQTQVYTDEMELITAAGCPFEIVKGDENNFKITTPEDLERARALVGGRETRTGIGFDIHRFSSDETRPLMLGGIRFEGAPALDGHSDADVVLHAVVDALFGAAGLGDIGQHFANTDPKWQDEPSSTFLLRAAEELRKRGWEIVNVDISMIGEKPKVMSRSDEVRTAIASALRIQSSRIGFKATTNEGLGSLGRAEGISAYAVATIREK